MVKQKPLTFSASDFGSSLLPVHLGLLDYEDVKRKSDITHRPPVKAVPHMRLHSLVYICTLHLPFCICIKEFITGWLYKRSEIDYFYSEI